MTYGFIETTTKLYYWELGYGFNNMWRSWAEFVEYHIKNGQVIQYRSEEILPSSIREVWTEEL